MNNEEFRAMAKELLKDKDLAHRHAYQRALALAGKVDVLAWDDLTEEQRVRMREANEEHWKRMQELGTAIHNMGKDKP